MKKILISMALLFSTILCYSQTVAISATVVDSDSTTWANGSWKMEFAPNPSQPNIDKYNINGTPLSPSVTNQSGAIDSSGNLSVTVYQNQVISPAGSEWTITVCPNAVTACGVYKFAANSSTLNLSSILTTVIKAPRFQARAGAYGYNDGEAILNLIPGATYWNVTSLVSRCYTGPTSNSWGACSTGGGSGITQLTGDVTAGPGSGSQAATLATVGSSGTCGDATHSCQMTVNAKGLATGISQVAINFPAGGITQLTGDGTAGPGSGSQAFTLATVNSSPGACGDSSHVCQVTTNAKGLVTAQTAVSIVTGSPSTQTNCLTTSCAGGSAYASGTTYTNSSGTAVLEEVTLNSTGGGGCVGNDASLTSTIGGVTGPASWLNNTCTGSMSIAFVVPAGATFSATATHVDGSGATVSIGGWLEINNIGGGSGGGGGGVSAVSVATANGFQGSSSGGSTPVLTLNVDGSHYLPTTTDESNWNGKQAALNLLPGTYIDGDLCSYAASGTKINCNTTPGGTGNMSDGVGSSTAGLVPSTNGTAHDYALSATLPTGLTMLGADLGTKAEHNAGTCTTAITLAATPNRQSVTLTNGDSCILSFTQPSSGTITLTVRITQGSLGTAVIGTNSSVYWSSGSGFTITPPAVPETGGAIAFAACYEDGTNTWCSLIQ